MNKNRGSGKRPPGSKSPGGSRLTGRASTTRLGAASIPPASHLPLETPLSRHAVRLLAVLAEPGAIGRQDRLEDGWILLSRSTSGLSLSAGRFPMEAAELLVRRDLAAWGSEGSAPTSLRITPAGSSHVRRAGAPGDAFLAQHEGVEAGMIVTEEGRDYLLANLRESPLEWLHRRRGRDGRPLIEEEAYQAGERLRVDITLAGMLPGISARWEEPGARSGPGEATDRMVAARQRVRHAFDSVGGDFSDLLTDLCGFLKGLEQIERERGWPARSAKVVVGLALRRLAEHYGLQGSTRGPDDSRGIRAWQAVVIEGGRS
jgi:hypothetical protein